MVMVVVMIVVVVVVVVVLSVVFVVVVVTAQWNFGGLAGALTGCQDSGIGR